MAHRAIVAFLITCLAVLPAMAQTPKKEPPAKKDAPAAQKKAPAGDVAGDNPVVARVNGVAIYRTDLTALRSRLPPQVQQQPPEQLYPRLVDQLVALQLVAQSARKMKLNEEPNVKTMTMLADEEILQDAYLDNIMRKEITEAKLRERYDQQIKTMPAHDEVHARHILVPTEDQAKALIEELKKGADFAKLASDKTTDPSGKNSGGDLGYFSQTDMVPEFAAAAFALKPGEFTQTPVKTQFGWHVIKVEDRRAAKAPTYEQIAPQLARQMSQELYGQKVKELASTAKIEVFNADGSKPPPAPSAAAPTQAPTAAAAPTAGEPQLLPMQNGTPNGPASASHPPTLSPATQNLGK